MKILRAIYDIIFKIIALPFILAVIVVNLTAKVLYVAISICWAIVLMFNPRILARTLTVIETMTVKEQEIISVHIKMKRAREMEKALKDVKNPKNKK